MRTVTMMAMAAGLLMFGLAPAGAEILERELGTDAGGNVVTGYVFQGGREFRGGARRASGLAPREVERPSRQRGRIDRGYSHGYFSPGWVVPVIPLYGCGCLSLWHGTRVGGVTITVIR